MLRKSMLIATLTAFSAVFLFALFVGCNGSENYAPKEPGFSTNNPIGTFGAAGSTFIAPLFSRWSNDYVTSHHMRVNYRPIGSGAALGELKQGLLTFAATDAPLGDAELKDMPPLIQVPVTAGPVCVIYNVTGLTGSLKLGGKTLAGIYSGQIRTWDEAAIARENPGLKLPRIPLLSFIVWTAVERQAFSLLTSALQARAGRQNPAMVFRSIGQSERVRMGARPF